MGGNMKKNVVGIVLTLIFLGIGSVVCAKKKTVWVPILSDGGVGQQSKNVYEGTQEILNMADDDSITLTSFSDLADAKFRINRPYIIARAESVSGTHHYYDAHALNYYLFGFLGLTGFRSLDTYTDPLRNKIARLDYFILNSADEEAFVYLCSYVDFIHKPEYWRDFFYGNQPAPELSLAKKYEIAQDIIIARQRDSYRLACNYLDFVANEKGKLDDDQDLKAVWQAQALLGDLYYHGMQNGSSVIIPKDYQESVKYWSMLLDNGGATQYEVANAYLHLGKMYHEGDSKLFRNYAKAYDYYTSALEKAGENNFSTIVEEAVCGKQDIATNKEQALKDFAVEILRIQADQTLSRTAKREKLTKMNNLEESLRLNQGRERQCSLQ